jgi:hypothetical protein
VPKATGSKRALRCLGDVAFTACTVCTQWSLHLPQEQRVMGSNHAKAVIKKRCIAVVQIDRVKINIICIHTYNFIICIHTYNFIICIPTYI